MQDISKIVNLGMQHIFNLNGQNIPLLNAEEYSLDFSAEQEGVYQFSPNAFVAGDFSPEIPRIANGNPNPAQIIDDWIAQYSILANIPFSVTTNGTTTMQGNLVLQDGQYRVDRNAYKIPARDYRKTFAEQAQTLNLRALDYTNQRIGYVISRVPDYETAAVLAISVYTISVQIEDAVAAIAEASAKIAAAAAALGAGAVASASVELASAIVKLATLAVGIVILLDQIKDSIYQDVRFYNCIDVSEILTKSCLALGYEFESSLLDGLPAPLAILGSTDKIGANSGTPDNVCAPDMSLFDFIAAVAAIFNAKAKITTDRKVIFENKEFFYSANQVGPTVLRKMKNSGIRRTNAREWARSLSLRWQTDALETNTIDRVERLLSAPSATQTKGNALTATFDFAALREEDKAELGKLDVTIPFARAFRKEKQSAIEILVNSLFDLLTILNPFQRFEGDFANRIGCLMLNQDAVGIPKVFLRDGEKVHAENFDFTHVENVYNSYYLSEKPFNNQWLIYEGSDAQPICSAEDVASLVSNNVCTDSEGNVAIVQRHLINDVGLHELSYRTPTPFDSHFYVQPSDFSERVVIES